MNVVCLRNISETCSCCNHCMCIAFASVVLLVVCVVVYLLFSKIILYNHEKSILKHSSEMNNRQSLICKDGKFEYCPITGKKLS